MRSVSIPCPTTLFIVDSISCIASSPTYRTYPRVALWKTVFPRSFGKSLEELFQKLQAFPFAKLIDHVE